MNRQQRRASKTEASPGQEDAMQVALAHHQSGRIDEAIAIYNQVLATQPQHAHALHFLGLALGQKGDSRRSVELMTRAVRLAPKESTFHSNLGNAHLAAGELALAVACFEKATQLNPGVAELHYNLALALSKKGDADRALQSYASALRIREAYPEAHNGAGVILLGRAQPVQAELALSRAVALAPDYARAHNNLGNALAAQGKLEEALASLRRAVELDPANADFLNNLANVHRERFDYDSAMARYREALCIDNAHVTARTNLGTTLYQLGFLGEAIAEFESALEADPSVVSAKANLALALLSDDRVSRERIYQVHRELGACIEGPVARMQPRGIRSEGKLRIGYLSGDLRRHSVAFFAEAVLHHHDRERFEVFAYNAHATRDSYSERLRSHVTVWQDVAGLSDDALAAVIRDNQVDVLIDLSGHTHGNRLGVFAKKPAPVQMTWIGYPATTGMSSIDYRIVDATTDDAGAEAWATEQLLRLEEPFLCFTPQPDAPSVSKRRTDSIVFGCFNAAHKMQETTLQLWARLLRANPTSKLIVKSHAFSSQIAQRRVVARLEALGVAGKRVAALPWEASAAAHLDAYGQVDVALDTYPYNGTTTTCEALWMGVPVITLTGIDHAARVGTSLLRAVGLPDCVARDEDEYVQLASALANDTARLKVLRATLRERMHASPLCDGQAFTQKFESRLVQICGR